MRNRTPLCGAAGSRGGLWSDQPSARNWAWGDANPVAAEGRYPVAKVAFGPIYGSGCPAFGACACGGATTLAAEASCQLGQLATNDIPITAYLFDGYGWSKANSSETSTCTVRTAAPGIWVTGSSGG